MRFNRVFVLAMVSVLFLLFLANCTAPPTPTPVVVTRVATVLVKETVIQTVVVPTEKVVTATPLPPTPTPKPATIRMYFVPSTEVDKIIASGKKIADMLKKSTGYDFEVAVPTSYAAVIEALCAGKADVAWLATFAYVLASEKCGVEAKLATVRFGLSTYNAEFITLADKERQAKGLKPIKTLEDLNGAKFAFTDPVSASGYLFPKYMLEQAKVKLGQEIFAGGHPQVVLAVYKGEVDAGATFFSPLRPDGTIGDARRNVIETYPDVEQKVKILRLSDPIPNDTVSFRKDLPQDVKDKIVSALLAMAKTSEGVKVLGELYNITGLAPASDADYDIVRGMAKTLGIDLGKLVK